MKINLRSKLGIKLELELINSLGQKIGQSYISQLIDMSDDQTIKIAAPIHESRLMLITPGTRIRAIFLDEKHGLLSFQGAITHRERTESIISLHVKIDGEFEKIQRRNYFRLDTLLNVTYCLYNGEAIDDKSAPPEPSPVKKGITRNISGNGASIVIEEEVVKGSSIDLTIWLTRETSIKVIAKVIRCTLLENTRDKKYELGLYFMKISQKDQDVLVKHIFDQQRLLLKNSIAEK
ncbi:MAG: flagellar brake protein [Clostridia bacterium]|nr:flagellar brake protein [Clostridia bacterium]